jgi:phenylalanyl-tRNA synthetase alpha chain
VPHAEYLTSDQLFRALNMRDLTVPAQGEHAIQMLLDSVATALQTEWGCTVRHVRTAPIVPVRENYDRLGYDPSDVTRARRYTRYISSTVMLRSHTSAVLPTALEDYAEQVDVDELIVVPGLVYRRDAVDGRHVGEPHQVDLWRIRDTPDPDDSDMLTMIGRMRKLSQPSRSSVARRPGSVLTASPASSGS